jgi:hypothetical protein
MRKNSFVGDGGGAVAATSFLWGEEGEGGVESHSVWQVDLEDTPYISTQMLLTWVIRAAVCSSIASRDVCHGCFRRRAIPAHYCCRCFC